MRLLPLILVVISACDWPTLIYQVPWQREDDPPVMLVDAGPEAPSSSSIMASSASSSSEPSSSSTEMGSSSAFRCTAKAFFDLEVRPMLLSCRVCHGRDESLYPGLNFLELAPEDAPTMYCSVNTYRRENGLPFLIPFDGSPSPLVTTGEGHPGGSLSPGQALTVHEWVRKETACFEARGFHDVDAACGTPP